SLHNLKLNDQIKLDNHTYKITNLYIQAKDSISMSKVLEPKSTPTLTLMTCYGEKIAENDYTERLILTAELEK
ncbi:sortase, partial [TM7 phylum sp. oral taxon 351]